MKRKKAIKTTTRRKTGGAASPVQPQADRSVQVTAARMAQAESEDKADAAWLEETTKIERRLQPAHPNLAWYEVAIIAHKEFPPKPQGFRDRRVRCNRCGHALEQDPDYDAHFCRQCNRWTEAKCQDPNCEFCSKRSEKPLP